MGFVNFSRNRYGISPCALLVAVIFLNIITQSQCRLFPSSYNSTGKLYNSSSSDLVVGNYSFDREARRSVVSGGLFSIVSFNNSPCNASNGLVGSCYSARECTNLGGSQSGFCAGNFGACCPIMITCGGTATINNTYFVNQNFPSTTSGPLTCSITVKQISGATELYLDFTQFQIRGPSGPCTNDTFTVKVGGSSTTYPVLCGNNTGSDEYISWGTTSRRRRQFSFSSTTTAATTTLKTATITFNLASGSDTRLWQIRLVQFKPTDACAAPAGCLQYYRGLTGTVQSYNYNSGQGEVITSNSCVNQCFQLPSGYCSMLLTETTSTSFMLPGTAPNTCPSDYLLVNGQRFCGDTLGTNSMLRVNPTTGVAYLSIAFCTSNSNVDLDLGYSLTYTMQSC